MSINLFDANFYRAANPDLAAAGLTTDTQLLSHFQSYGIDEGRLFSSLANLNFYRSSNPDLAAAGLTSNRQAFNHLQNNGVAEGRRFSQFVDINFYLNANGDVNQAFGGNRERSLEHLRNNGVAEGRSFSPFIGVADETGTVNSLNYYLEVNPDVEQAFGGDRVQALQHLELNGVAEGRSFSPFVDLGYYLANNSDVNQAFGGNKARAFEHLVTSGLNEGRRFSPAFDVNFYRNNYPDLTNAGLRSNQQLFQHWVTYGVVIDERSGTSDPGNSFGTALNLGSPNLSLTGFNGSINSSDTDDYYRFTLNESRNIGIGIGGLSADLDLTLFDAGGNTLLSSSAEDITTDTVGYFNLNPGTYYIHVDQGTSNASSNYNLLIDIEPSVDAGSINDTAYILTPRVAPYRTVIRDSVGGSDTDDYYQVTLLEDGSLSVELDPFSTDADLYLYDSNGVEIDVSLEGGTDIDSIERFLTAGTYFLQVDGISSNTNYELQIDFV